MVEYSYDEEQDVLSIELDRVSHHSIPVGGLVIDVDNEGDLAGLEIFNASENLARYTDISIDEAQEVLENIEGLEVESSKRQGMMSIFVDFKSRRGKSLRETRMPLNVEASA